MPGLYKRPYDEEFRRNSVEMWATSGKSLKAISRELGVSDVTLRSWRDRLLGEKGNPDRSPGGGGGATPRDLAEENRQLRKDLERVTRQRDILKKAMGILSETSPGGMP
jgi:transposase-like protein